MTHPADAHLRAYLRTVPSLPGGELGERDEVVDEAGHRLWAATMREIYYPALASPRTDGSRVGCGGL